MRQCVLDNGTEPAADSDGLPAALSFGNTIPRPLQYSRVQTLNKLGCLQEAIPQECNPKGGFTALISDVSLLEAAVRIATGSDDS